jgi:hypothetical protein
MVEGLASWIHVNEQSTRLKFGADFICRYFADAYDTNKKVLMLHAERFIENVIEGKKKAKYNNAKGKINEIYYIYLQYFFS